jgi:hypothetical protein
MFLSYYNDIWVYGVTDAAAQQLVLDRVAEHFRQAQTHPVQVVFYDKENVSVRQPQHSLQLEGLPENRDVAQSLRQFFSHFIAPRSHDGQTGVTGRMLGERAGSVPHLARGMRIGPEERNAAPIWLPKW